MIFVEELVTPNIITWICALLLIIFLNFSKDGYLFDKEAILTYIITKKKEFARKMKEYERQLKEDEEEQAERANAETKKQVDRFISTEKNIVSSKTANPAGLPTTSFAFPFRFNKFTSTFRRNSQHQRSHLERFPRKA